MANEDKRSTAEVLNSFFSNIVRIYPKIRQDSNFDSIAQNIQHPTLTL